jgi:hypothetical protein
LGQGLFSLKLAELSVASETTLHSSPARLACKNLTSHQTSHQTLRNVLTAPGLLIVDH